MGMEASIMSSAALPLMRYEIPPEFTLAWSMRWMKYATDLKGPLEHSSFTTAGPTPLMAESGVTMCSLPSIVRTANSLVGYLSDGGLTISPSLEMYLRSLGSSPLAMFRFAAHHCSG